VHDVLNVFQVTGLDPVHEIYFMEPSPAKKGDFFEFFAEIDLLCAISTCPSVISPNGVGPRAVRPVATCRRSAWRCTTWMTDCSKDGPRPSPCGEVRLRGGPERITTWSNPRSWSLDAAPPQPLPPI